MQREKWSLVLGRGALVIALCSLGSACKTSDAKKHTGPTDLIQQSKDEQRAAQAKARVEQLTAQAAAAATALRWQDAAKFYGQASEADPTNWRLHMDRAIVQAKAKRFGRAIVSMRLALENGGKNDWEAWYNLGNIYQNRGMYAEAIEAYRTSVGLRGETDLKLLVNISSSYIMIHHFGDAIATINHILQIQPNHVPALHNLGLIPHIQQKHEEAIAAYDAALAVDPNFAQSIFNRADALSHLGRNREASEGYQRYLEVAPNGPYVTQAKAGVNALMNRPEGSLR